MANLSFNIYNIIYIYIEVDIPFGGKMDQISYWWQLAMLDCRSPQFESQT